MLERKPSLWLDASDASELGPALERCFEVHRAHSSQAQVVVAARPGEPISVGLLRQGGDRQTASPLRDAPVVHHLRVGSPASDAVRAAQALLELGRAVPHRRNAPLVRKLAGRAGLLPVTEFGKAIERAVGEGPACFLMAQADATGGAPHRPSASALAPFSRELADAVRAALGPSPIAAWWDAVRVAAFAPGADLARGLAFAAQLRASFAAAAPGGTTASVGLSVYPRDAATAGEGLALAADGLRRAAVLGGNRVADCRLPLVLLGGVFEPGPFASGLWKRIDVSMHFYDEPLAAVNAATRQGPDALVLDVSDAAVVEALARVQGSAAAPRSRLVLFTANESTSPRLFDFESAVVVTARQRLLPRLTEAVAGALGVRQRRSPRVPSRLPAALSCRARDGAEVSFSGELSNFSELGAVFICSEPVEAARVEVTFVLDEEPVTCLGEVLRQFRSGPSIEVALKFHRLSFPHARLLRGAVERHRRESADGAAWPDAAVRTSLRKAPPGLPRFTVRLRPMGQRATTYLRVLDLSESGLRAVGAAPAAPVFAAGDPVDLLIFGRRQAFSCSGEVVRAEKHPGSRLEIGARFLAMAPAAERTLASALGGSHRHGGQTSPGALERRRG